MTPTVLLLITGGVIGWWASSPVRPVETRESPYPIKE